MPVDGDTTTGTPTVTIDANGGTVVLPFTAMTVSPNGDTYTFTCAVGTLTTSVLIPLSSFVGNPPPAGATSGNANIKVGYARALGFI